MNFIIRILHFLVLKKDYSVIEQQNKKSVIKKASY